MQIMQNEAILRLAVFLGVFILMAIWEMIAPRRRLRASKPIRWINNLAIIFLNSALMRFTLPVAAIGVAELATRRGWGALNIIDIPLIVKVLLAVIILDLTIYLQHVIFHTVPALWRLHRMHHTDLDLDVTSGARFHPAEMILSMLIKMALVILIGAPPLAVLIFEVLLNATSMFNHSNVALPQSLDKALRWIIVTPDYHRVHHSVIICETNSNYGFSLTWWDRVFGTYISEPAKGHDDMQLGLANYRERRWLRLGWMLAVPFMKQER